MKVVPEYILSTYRSINFLLNCEGASAHTKALSDIHKRVTWGEGQLDLVYALVP